jgi:hypothetical protein
MWKNMKTALAVATIASGLSLGTALAQDNTAPASNAPPDNTATGVNTAPATPAPTTVDRTNDTAANTNNTHNTNAQNGNWGWGWGWIGLAGLIGLFGLMPRDNNSQRDLGPTRRPA